MNLIKIKIFILIIKLIECFSEKFKIWGPGLKANFNMPVRYFFIKSLNKNFKNLTKDFFKIEIYNTQNQNKHIRAHVEILNKNDGSFIVRYKLYDNYRDVFISIKNKFNQKHIAKSPYFLNGNLYQEYCFCPEYDLNKWLKDMSCNQTYTQIENDLSKFNNKKLNMDHLGKLVINKYNQRYSQSLCNYVILNNKIYKKCYGEYVDFSMFSDNILLSLSRKVILPNTEFFMNLGDWPLNEKKQNLLLPIISWCGSTNSNDLVLPTYDLTESTIEMMGRQSLDIFSIQENSKPEWELKQNKSFWRGRDSRQERLDLILMSKLNPDLIDAGLTNMFFYREKEHLNKYGPIVERTSFFDFFKYKYQLNIDGTVAAYRFPYLLVGNSVIFKQDSNFYEHFYVDLKPFVHYVPINRNLTNLTETIKWAIKNDKKIEKISKNAKTYARKYLQPNHIYCYHAKFFISYTHLISSEVKVRKEMKEVLQPVSNCKCKRQKDKNFKFDL